MYVRRGSGGCFGSVSPIASLVENSDPKREEDIDVARLSSMGIGTVSSTLCALRLLPTDEIHHNSTNDVCQGVELKESDG